jgi:hypothetical protein
MTLGGICVMLIRYYSIARLPETEVIMLRQSGGTAIIYVAVKQSADAYLDNQTQTHSALLPKGGRDND